MATDARERLRAALERFDEWNALPSKDLLDREFGEWTARKDAIVRAARALLAEPPPAGDAALLHQINGVLRWVEGLLGSNIEAVLIADELRHAIARAATPAAAEPDGLAEAREAMRPLSDEQALLTLFRENKRLRAAAEPEDTGRDALREAAQRLCAQGWTKARGEFNDLRAALAQEPQR